MTDRFDPETGELIEEGFNPFSEPVVFFDPRPEPEVCLVTQYGLPPHTPKGICGRPLRELVDSTIIRSMAYLPAKQVLEIERRGRYYRDILQYHDVPFQVWMGLWSHLQKATYFFMMVEPNFRHKKVCSITSFFARPPWVQWERLEEVHQTEEANRGLDKSKRIASQWGFQAPE